MWHMHTKTHAKPKPLEGNHGSSKKRRKRNHNNVNEAHKLDAISNLPDDILVYLLSFMDMKTAGRTSLLSKRWRYVWTHLVDLNFDDPAFFLLYKRSIWKQVERYVRYHRWVMQVITANRAPCLNSFKIHFPFDGFYAADIDKWVDIALSKNVCNLELNLSTWLGCAACEVKNAYIIRHGNLFKRFTQYPNVTLKSLHLEALSVQRTVLENISSNCPNLELLTVRTCRVLPINNLELAISLRMGEVLPVNKLAISFFNMKHFELSHCRDIRSLQISGPKLTSLIFSGWELEVVYSDVPALVSVTFREKYCYEIFHNLRIFSNFSSQLQQLSLHWRPESFPTEFPAFPNVRQLDITVANSANEDDNILALISFIEACPVLHTFKLKLRPPVLGVGAVSMSAQKDAQVNAIRAHKHLKAVEFIGYFGNASVAELALCLAKHASMLTKIVFDPHSPQTVGNLHILEDIILNSDNIPLWRIQAEALAVQIRVGVDVVIL